MRRAVAAVLCVFLAGCGGGGSDGGATSTPAPTPITFTPGAYSSTFSPGGPVEPGIIIFDTTGIVTYETKTFVGFGSWQRPGATVDVNLTVLPRRVDSLNNEFLDARAPSTTRTMRLNVGQQALSGDGWQLLQETRISAPALTAIPRGYRFRNLYNFSGTFLDYTLQVDVDAAGVLTGFDTNGCTFVGAIESRSAGTNFYNARVTASQCGATNSYIQNFNFIGYAYLSQSASFAGQVVLNFVGTSPSAALAFAAHQR